MSNGAPSERVPSMDGAKVHALEVPLTEEEFVWLMAYAVEQGISAQAALRFFVRAGMQAYYLPHALTEAGPNAARILAAEIWFIRALNSEYAAIVAADTDGGAWPEPDDIDDEDEDS